MTMTWSKAEYFAEKRNMDMDSYQMWLDAKIENLLFTMPIEPDVAEYAAYFYGFAELSASETMTMEKAESSYGEAATPQEVIK